MNAAHEPVRGFVCAKCRDYKTRHDEDAARRAGCPDDVCEGCFDLMPPRPTLWEEDPIGDTDDIAEAIERWHVEHDLACPADAEFAAAKVLVKVGTRIGADPDRMLAEECRVVMPRGNVYSLLVEYDADLRGEDWHEQIAFFVDSAEVVR